MLSATGTRAPDHQRHAKCARKSAIQHVSARRARVTTRSDLNPPVQICRKWPLSAGNTDLNRVRFSSRTSSILDVRGRAVEVRLEEDVARGRHGGAQAAFSGVDVRGDRGSGVGVGDGDLGRDEQLVGADVQRA